jgi:hypothetical protein
MSDRDKAAIGAEEAFVSGRAKSLQCALGLMIEA